MVLVAALAALIFVYLFTSGFFGLPGFLLNSEVMINYDDGTSQTFRTTDNLLQRLSVIQASGKKISSVTANIYGTWKSTPAGQSVKVQYWIVYYIEVQGTFFSGGRAYSSLLGFIDTPLSTFSSTETTNRWNYLGNNIVPDATFLNNYYQERGSGLQVGQLNLGPEYAKAVCDAFKGVPLAGTLATKLTTLLATATVKDGDRVDMTSWTQSGPTFYVNLKRTNWQGASINLGDFTLGVGKWTRMAEGDSYTVKFHAGYFFRWQDLTGEWAPWKSGDITVSTLSLQVVAGQWVILGLTIGGGVTVT